MLPRLLLLTDRHASGTRGRSPEQTVREAVDSGARAVLLREKDLPFSQRLRLGADLLDILDPAGGTLIVASDLELATALGAGWVHLSARDPVPVDIDFDVGRSCHNTVELQAACRQRIAYVTLSPVFATASKPGYGPVLGPTGLRDLIGVAASTPVYALGGVEPGRVRTCLDAGAYGIAVMGAVMGAESPGKVTAALLAEFGE